MARQRSVSTSLWEDEWFVEALDHEEKIVWFYLLTNGKTNIAGVYKIKLSTIEADTTIPRDRIEDILNRFCRDGKATFESGWIVIHKWPAHQQWTKKKTIDQGIQRCLMDIPDWLFAKIKAGEIPYTYPMDRVPRESDTYEYGTDTSGYGPRYSNPNSNSNSNPNPNSNSKSSASATPDGVTAGDDTHPPPAERDTHVPIHEAADDEELYKAIEQDFLGRQPGRRFTNWGKEGKAIKQLIVKARARSPDDVARLCAAQIAMFRRMKRNGSKGLREKPDLPSALNTEWVWDAVLEQVARQWESLNQAMQYQEQVF